MAGTSATGMRLRAGSYDAAGKQVNRKIWDALKNKARIETDEELAAFLETHTHKSLADLIRNWDSEVVK